MCSICRLPWATLSNLNQPETISVCTFWVVFSVFGKGMARHLNSVCSLIVASTSMCMVGKRKGLPYSLPRVGSGVDPGVQAVSPQVTWSHPPGGRLPLLSAIPAVTFPAEERHCPSAGPKLYCFVTEAHACEQLEADRSRFGPATFRIASERSTVKSHRPLTCMCMIGYFKWASSLSRDHFRFWRPGIIYNECIEL